MVYTAVLLAFHKMSMHYFYTLKNSSKLQGDIEKTNILKTERQALTNRGETIHVLLLKLKCF